MPMYELIILSLLMRWPLHGYMIAKITNDMIGPLAKVSNGTLYPLLTKLEQAGLIATHIETGQQRGERHLRSFQITELGRKRFHALMMDITSNPGEYQKFFRYKVLHMDLLSPEERLHLIDHYINYCQAHRLHLHSEAQNLVQENADSHFMSQAQLEATLDTMGHMTNQWQAELEWVRHLREKEIARSPAPQQQLLDEHRRREPE
jgi:DNA-binding PadR family transcriptional regulator